MTAAGSATLSATGFNFEMTGRLPLQVVMFKLGNQKKYTGRFVLSNINGPQGRVEAPAFASELALVDVPPGKADAMIVSVSAAGTYAFHCG